MANKSEHLGNLPVSETNQALIFPSLSGRTGKIQMLIDSHAHLDMKDFDRDRQQVLDRARQGGLTHVINIGIDHASALKGLQLSAKHDFIFSSIGYHPHNAEGADASQLKALSRLVNEPKVVAWGEIGLDFFRNHAPHDKQLESFERQLDMAFHFNLPVIIHDREAHEKILEILKTRGSGSQRGVIHCFSGTYDLAMAFIDLGYYISIPGVVTYKNALSVHEVASRIPLESMLIETDAPFLAPAPFRGKRNEPLFVKYTAEKIAQLRHMDFGDVARQTAENAINLFRLPRLKMEDS